MKTLTIHVDNREKTPFKFPATMLVRSKGKKDMPVRILTQETRLPIADYVLGDEPGNTYFSYDTPSTVIIERKHSIDELAQNVLARRERFCEILEAMAEGARYPILVFDQKPSALLKPTKHTKNPGPILDDVQRLCYNAGVHFQIIPASTASERLAAGELTARTLINGEYWKR
jgi:ERCC4-type nuclease